MAARRGGPVFPGLRPICAKVRSRTVQLDIPRHAPKFRSLQANSPCPHPLYDYAIVGGGIVGFAAAYHLARRFPGAQIVLLEKEPEIARHQTGRNSGVIHSGIYYKPGSFKARFTQAGATGMVRFCEENGIPLRGLRQADRGDPGRGAAGARGARSGGRSPTGCRPSGFPWSGRARLSRT